jgi:hypothetical protein
MLRKLLGYLGERGTVEVGQGLQENTGLVRLALSLGFTVTPQDEDTLALGRPLR